ncbi:hypothetical protein D3C85_1466820 [compost metagenome]
MHRRQVELVVIPGEIPDIVDHALVIDDLPTIVTPFKQQTFAARRIDHAVARTEHPGQHYVGGALLLMPAAAVVVPDFAIPAHGVDIRFGKPIHRFETDHLLATVGRPGGLIDGGPLMGIIPAPCLAVHPYNIHMLADGAYTT